MNDLEPRDPETVRDIDRAMHRLVALCGSYADARDCMYEYPGYEEPDEDDCLYVVQARPGEGVPWETVGCGTKVEADEMVRRLPMKRHRQHRVVRYLRECEVSAGGVVSGKPS